MMVSNVRPNLKEEELVTEQPEQLLTPATEPRGKNLEGKYHGYDSADLMSFLLLFVNRQ